MNRMKRKENKKSEELCQLFKEMKPIFHTYQDDTMKQQAVDLLSENWKPGALHHH